MCKFDDIALALRWLLRHIPLVSPFARDPDFRVLHPYAARSEAIFLQWNIGKQRAAEVGPIGLALIPLSMVCPWFLLAVTCFLIGGVEQCFLVSYFVIQFQKNV
jgi:hypothetical protein